MVRVVRLSVGLLPCNGTDNAVGVAGADTGSKGSRKEEDSLAVVECGSVLFPPGIVVNTEMEGPVTPYLRIVSLLLCFIQLVANS